MTDWDISTLPAAIAGLRDRAQELQDYPGRLHVQGVWFGGPAKAADDIAVYDPVTGERSDADLVGGSRLASPRMSWGFQRILDDIDDERPVHAKENITEERVCHLAHDFGADCPNCHGFGTYATTRTVYTRPLARALVKLSHAKSKVQPHPLVIIAGLLAEGFSIERTAMRYGVIIMSADQRKTEEARILSAIRALRNRYEETVLGPAPKWTELSEAQQNAEDAA